ncbi:tripartite motif-containing protein 2-like [Ptychodera flava]|uniref:tripartite motif-containing protein 2-like n=1 Tax=Ptychodera flava TaxID=63121 RepID=UPI00396A4647
MKENEASRSKVVVMEMIRSLDRCYYREEKKMTRHIQKRRVTRLGRKYGDMLLRELNDVYDKRKSDLNTQLKELERIKCDMSHAREYTEKLMHYGNAARLMSAKKDIASRIEQVLNVETKTDPDETDYMEFQPCDDFYATKSVGVLLVSTTPADHCQLVDVPEFVRKDEDIIFTMIATDVQGTETMDRNVEINAVMKRPDNTLEDITAINNNDGTWSLKCKAKMTGKHEITVSVFKKPVNGSPVTINVIPKKGLICEFGKYGLGREELGDVYGVMVTRNQNIRFCDNSNGRLKTFTVDGKYICTTKFSNISTRVTPLFSAVSEDGSVFTTEDNFRQVIVHKENGRVMRCFGEGVIYFPYGIAISPIDGRVYVVDIWGHCIRIFSQDGKYYKSFASQGQGDGQLNSPVDIAIDAAGKVFVSDKENHRIQVFDAEGQYLYSFGSRGSGDNQMSYPWGISLDSDGSVYVCDHGNNRVMKYESRGKFICRIDYEDNRAENPSGICVTDDKPFGKVVVVNRIKCVQVFSQETKYSQ